MANPNDVKYSKRANCIPYWRYHRSLELWPWHHCSHRRKGHQWINPAVLVVEVDRLQLWVPVEEGKVSSIRFPTESGQFEALFDILRTPGELLPDHQYQRRLELQGRMKKRTLADLCHLIRDLADRSHQHTLNQNDAVVLSRAEDLLLDEWMRSLRIDRTNAFGELEVLLRGGLPEIAEE